MHVRPVEKADHQAFARFAARIPAGYFAFFKEDVSAPDVVDSWARDPRSRRLLAHEDDEIIGYAAVLGGIGWTDHVGEIQVVVDPARQRGGVGRALARAALGAAIELGLEKAVVEIIADQEPALSMFRSLGFVAEALLLDQVKDARGNAHDLMILAHTMNANRESMAALGLELELGSTR